MQESTPMSHCLRTPKEMADKVKTRKKMTKAKNEVNKAVRKGMLPSVSECKCGNSACDSQASVYHHYDYEPNNVLAVSPLCSSCHYKIHSDDGLIL